jgi:hypothetical protein
MLDNTYIAAAAPKECATALGKAISDAMLQVLDGLVAE